MFSLRDFHNLAGQSSEQCSLTGAGPTSSGRWFEGLWVFLPKFFIFFFFLTVICLCWLPWHHSICFPKVVSFLAGFGCWKVHLLLWCHQRAVDIGSVRS